MGPARLAVGTIAPLPADTLMHFLLQVGILLGLAFLLGHAAERIGLPSVAGELAAGVVLGPSLLAHLAPGLSDWFLPCDPAQTHLLDAVGQLSVLLLVGFTGMHIDISLARNRGCTAAGVSAAALLVPLALGIALAYALPHRLMPAGANTFAFACFIGVATCVSSIPIIGRVLVDMRLIDRPVGQMIMVVATIDDAVGWLLVSVVTALATTGLTVHDIAVPLWHMAVLLLVTLTVGGWTVRRVLKWAHRSGSHGPTVTATVLLLVWSGAGAHALGFEPLLGAFLCGILIGACDDGHQSRRMEPLDTTVLAFLSPLFFALAGLRVDLTALATPSIALWGLAALGIAVVGKYLGAFVGAAAGKLNWWEAVAVGAGINARGVIQVVIAVTGVRIGLLNTAMYSIVVLIAVITPLMAPPVLKAVMKRLDRAERPTSEGPEPSAEGSCGIRPAQLP
ncbi:cation:proton antiporter [Streptomyces sp. NPDC052101]|uniref:cation:proton antiporter n=1 Tax=Streptomyces sp. NPDC052101 TaxID=3155763 RepID=UPI00341A13B1